MLLVIVKNAQGEVCAQVSYAGGALTIGRDKTRHIVLESKAVSRHHGSLLSSGGKVLYVDEGSSNGSQVDGLPVTAPVPLTHRSVIQIGEYTVRLQLQTSEAPVPSSPPPRPLSEAPAPSMEDTLAVEPVLPARPVVDKPAAPSALDDFRIVLPEVSREAPKKPEVTRFAEKVDGLLEQQIQGIRSQRQDHQETQRSRRELFEQAWGEAMAAAQQLKGRIGTDPRVLFFVIARDGGEATVKLKENSSRGFCNFSVSRRHPVKETVAEGLAWYSETGEEPRAYNNPAELMEDFVRAIAAKLA